MTPHVARGYYGGAVVLFWSGADASSEEQGIVDRGCRHRRGSRRPSGGGTRWIVHARGETSASNWNAVVDHGCAQPVRAGRYARRLSCRPPDQGGGGTDGLSVCYVSRVVEPDLDGWLLLPNGAIGCTSRRRRRELSVQQPLV